MAQQGLVATTPAARRRGGRPGVTRRRVTGRRTAVPYLFMLPGLVLFGVFFAWPAVLSIEASFTNYSVVNPVHWVGLANFRALAADPQFRDAIEHSFIVMAGLLPFSVAIPMALAVLVNRKLRGIQLFRAVYFLPVITSMVSVAVAWTYVFDDKGVLNWLLERLAVTHGPVHFLLDPHWALASVILVEGWKGIGTYMMIYLAGLQAIPHDLYEAAQIDGAGGWARFTRITAPLLRPFLAVAVTIELVNAMQVFTSVYVLTQGGPGDSTSTAGYFVWSEAFQKYRLGYASAALLVIWVILIALALANYRITGRRDTPRW